MDVAHGLSFMVLRPWLLIIGLSQLVLMASVFLLNKLHSKDYLSLSKLLEYSEHLADLTIGEVLLWGVIEVGLFAQGMVPFCSGYVFIYGITLIVVHIILFSVYLWCRKETMVHFDF
jgi:hypothetical protein